MGHWQPGRVWESVRKRVLEWIDEDGAEAASDDEEADPMLEFHLAITAPVVIGILILMRAAS
jgi:hypothetical protein